MAASCLVSVSRPLSVKSLILVGRPVSVQVLNCQSSVIRVQANVSGVTLVKQLKISKKYFSYFSTETYVVGTQMNHLNEMVLLSTHNLY